MQLDQILSFIVVQRNYPQKSPCANVPRLLSNNRRTESKMKIVSDHIRYS